MQQSKQALVLCVKLTPQIALITLNDAANLNAMSEAMALEFSRAVENLQSDTELAAVIIIGAGRAFSAGGDLAMLQGKTLLDPARNRALMLEFYASFLKLLKLNVPLIAAINGHAVGAGLCVACACDVRIAADTAKFGFTFVKLGLHPGMGAIFNVPRVIGIAAASELLLTGRIINATDALRLGLCSQVIATEELKPDALLLAAQKIAQEISDNGREAVRQLLGSLRDAPASLQAALELESAHQAVNYASKDFAERVAKALARTKKPAS